MRLRHVAPLLLVVTVIAQACRTGGAEPIAVAAVIDDVDYSPGCQNEPVEIGGATWYPLSGLELTREIDVLTNQDLVTPDAGPTGFRDPASRPPGPGDDTGTLVVDADGSPGMKPTPAGCSGSPPRA